LCREIIQNAIDNDEIPSYEAFISEPKAKRRKRQKFYEREKKEAEAELAKQNIGSYDILIRCFLPGPLTGISPEGAEKSPGPLSE